MRISRFLSQLATVAVAGVTAVALAATPAHASIWQLNDGFEVSPATTWSCWNSVADPKFVNGCRIGYASPNPYEGTRTSWIQANSGWSDIGRTVWITPYQSGRTLTCAAQMRGRLLTNNTQLRGQLEVIDSATWRYTSIKPFTLTKADDLLQWRAITTASWTAAGRDVYVRIGILGENLGELDAMEVDNLIVQCQYY